MSIVSQSPSKESRSTHDDSNTEGTEVMVGNDEETEYAESTDREQWQREGPVDADATDIMDPQDDDDATDDDEEPIEEDMDDETEEDEEQREAEEEEEEEAEGEEDEELDEEEEEQDEDDNNILDDFDEDDSPDEDQVDSSVHDDMSKLQRDFPGFKDRYRLIKRIGEGTFSTVFKAEDIHYDRYDNSWDIEDDQAKWTPPPLKRSREDAHLPPSRGGHSPYTRRRPRFVAIKKIYVTSSPVRILNEIELLHQLRQCPSVCPLITAFRQTDQVIAILPYFRHADFRAYFRDMTIPDVAIYLRSLFLALRSVHKHRILHRDIKPTNFLYDPKTQHGVLVDFGLAEREGTDARPCLCHERREVRKHRQVNSVWAQSAAVSQPGYPKVDTRPSRRANRAGTRGFRAPEVLFKCTEQTPAIDIWSVGVIMLTILSKRFPFFNSADDVEALIEIATIFGTRRMRAAALLHGCGFETSIPTVGQLGFSLEKIILWSTCRSDDKGFTEEEKLAVRFLVQCMELDPTRRITADEALEHDLLKIGQPADSELGDDDEVEMLQA